MADSDDQITGKQAQLLTALLSEPTVGDAARKVGCGERTARRWLTLPPFREAYRQAKRDALNQASSRLQACAGEAVETLRSIMADPRSPAGTRVTAAKAVLDAAAKAGEVEDLTERVAELEAKVNSLGERPLAEERVG